MRIKQDDIVSINDISRLIGASVGTLTYYANNMESEVRERREPKERGGVRLITAPSEGLKRVLKSIKDTILLQYEYPDYVYGLGGNTLREHALVHAGEVTTVKLDVRDFYPSLKNQWVYSMWIEKFNFDPEAARILTKLTTLHGGLTQGFPTSSHIAAIVAESFTKELDVFAKSNGLRFSQYVDDLNLSGKAVDRRLVFKTVISLAHRSGLSIKKRKTKVTSPKDGKVITGAAVFGKQTRATKKVRQRSIQAIKALQADPNDEYNIQRVIGYAGFLKHLRPSDGRRFMEMAAPYLPRKKQKK